jgi:hypothetical protein
MFVFPVFFLATVISSEMMTLLAIVPSVSVETPVPDHFQIEYEAFFRRLLRLQLFQI